MKSEDRVEALVEDALRGRRLETAEIESLLSTADERGVEVIFAGARTLRERYFGCRVFLYGFVYFSTHCRNSCAFCFYRKGNEHSPRYRKTPAEVAEVAAGLAESGVHLIDLTMGEDPRLHEQQDFSSLLELVRDVRRLAGVPVMVSPGVVPGQVLGRLREAGADWYACYQETHTPELYRRLRPRQDYLRRAAARMEAMAAGLHAEDGILIGVGETVADRARSLVAMEAQGVRQARVMGFVPQEGTPLAGLAVPDLLTEMVTLAVMRLVLPDRLIPASLDIDGLRGLRARLHAGANVVTSIIPPSSGMAGVAQARLDIDQGFRTVANVRRQLEPLGLETASLGEYEAWIEAARQQKTAQTPALA
jgi:methylornithine synthase